MEIGCTKWPKSNANFGSILGQFVSNRDIGSLHLVHASGTMLNSCLCISYLGGLVHLGPHVLWSHFQNVDTQYAKWLIHTFWVYVFVLCVLVVLFFGTGHLNGSWFLTAQGYMLDWLGDVTSTVSFCQLSGGVCYPMNLCMNCMLCMGSY